MLVLAQVGGKVLSIAAGLGRVSMVLHLLALKDFKQFVNQRFVSVLFEKYSADPWFLTHCWVFLGFGLDSVRWNSCCVCGGARRHGMPGGADFGWR